jgi:hypothetical protein
LDAAVTRNPVAKLDARPLLIELPVQVALAKRLTVDPASALPVIVRAVDCDGEDGLMPSEFGAAGAVESLT